MGDALNMGPGATAQAYQQKMRDGVEYVPPVGVFDGTVGAVGSTVGALVNVPVAAFGEVANAAVQPVAEGIDKKFGTDIAGFLDEETESAKQTAANMRPSAATTGMAGQILYELGTVAVPAAVGSFAGPGGSIGLTGAFKAYEEANHANQNGMDGVTAAGKGLIKGAEMASAVALPASFGFRLGREVAAQGAVSALSGMASRGATGKLLEERGYREAAAQYDWLNAHETAADLVFGALVSGAVRGLGAITGRGPDANMPSTPQIDAAAEVQAAKLYQSSTLPGAPVNAHSVNTHIEALNDSVQKLVAGEPVEVTGILGRRSVANAGADLNNPIARAAAKSNEIADAKEANFEAWDNMSPGQKMMAQISDEMAVKVHKDAIESGQRATKVADDIQARRSTAEAAIRAEKAAADAQASARAASGQVTAKDTAPKLPEAQQRQVDELHALARSAPDQKMEYDGELLSAPEVAKRFEAEANEAMDFKAAAKAAALCSFGV